MLRSKNLFYFLYIFSHVSFSILLGNFYGFAPDETGYLYTLNNLYGPSIDPNPQFGSGWIATSKPFLWTIYLPAKIMMELGVADYLAIRCVSLIAGFLTMLLLVYSVERSAKTYLRLRHVPRLFYFFYLPSIFMWQSIGLRDGFIVLELTAIAVGTKVYLSNGELRNLILVAVGSFGLLSTKNYQWIFLALSILISIGIIALTRRLRREHLRILLVSLILPAIIYSSTTSIYALGFFFRGSITETGLRSGDSVSIVTLPKVGTVGTPTPKVATPTPKVATPSNGDKKISIHGDSTVVGLYRHLIDSPKSSLSTFLQKTGVYKVIIQKYSEVVEEAIKNNSKPVSNEESPHVLIPGSLMSPLSIVRASFNFLFGPIPLMTGGGLFLKLISIESPFWWLLVGLLVLSIIRAKKRLQIFQNFETLVFGCYLLIVVITSALVEVNLGTSFRHRSLVLIPILILINFFWQLRSQENKSKD
jgi:hypothetical protein